MASAEDVSATSNKFALTRADVPTIILSSICFITHISLGYFVSAIGAAIPEIADDLNRESTSLSVIYTARGVGFLIGTLFGGAQNEITVLKQIRTDILVCIPTLVVSLGAFLLFILPLRLWVILVVVCVQASMFSFLDVVANIMLMELWGRRVEPWLQALHACFGVGAVVGPAIVGVVRFRISNLCLSLLCLLPSTIAIVSSFCIKREGMKQGVTENGEACAESGKYEVAVSDQDDENDDGNGKGDGPVEKTTRSSPLISNFLRSLFILFYFVYVGLETGFGGWISAYSLDMDITDSESRAAYLSSIFFFGITLGRLLSVPSAMYVTPTRMMCILFAVVWLGVVMFTVMTTMQEHATYAQITVACAVLGLGISSMYPVGLTIAQDYDVVMDSRTITVCCIGAVGGEAVMPMLFGVLMHAFTPAYLTYCTFVVAVIVTLLYIAIHFMFLRTVADFHQASDKSCGAARKGEMCEMVSFNPLNSYDEEAVESTGEDDSINSLSNDNGYGHILKGEVKVSYDEDDQQDLTEVQVADTGYAVVSHTMTQSEREEALW